MSFDFFLIFMSYSEVVHIHDTAINQFGGRRGIHDKRLLESALHHPEMMIEFGNDEDYKIHNLAAAYFFHIIQNHPFIDGNKRTGLLTALHFFGRNGFKLKASFQDLYQLALDTAASQISEKDVATFFKKVMEKIK